MPYSFIAGPDNERYLVETPWDSAHVFDVAVKVAERLGFDLEAFNGALLMLQGVAGKQLDSFVMLPASGIPGEGMTLGELRAMLEA